MTNQRRCGDPAVFADMATNWPQQIQASGPRLKLWEIEGPINTPNFPNRFTCPPGFLVDAPLRRS